MCPASTARISNIADPSRMQDKCHIEEMYNGFSVYIA